jgi:hypothetical protein
LLTDAASTPVKIGDTLFLAGISRQLRKNAMPTKSKRAPKGASISDECPLIPSAQWRLKYGNVSARTEYNWEKEGIIPAAVRINGRKYRRADTRPKVDGATP